MSENTTQTAVAVRERLITQAPVAIWDTADFEHMGRVAATMAESGLMSETFLKDGDDPASPKAVVARCLLVASIARECGANPLVFLQGCSIIGRKLHLEGKLVNAIVRARTGITLRFRMGVWDTDHIEFPPLKEDGRPDEKFFHGVGERLAIRCFDPDDPERYVEGSVGQWKTDRRGSPWSKQADWPRQLRYRAVPEWARAYEPGAILGINVDADEDLEPIEAPPKRPAKTDLRAKLPAPGGEGFNAERVAAETGAKPKGDYTQVDEQAQSDAAYVASGTDTQVHTLEERPTSQADATETAGAQPAAETPASSDSATDASAGSAAETSSPASTEPPSSDGGTGHAAPGEAYLLAGDEPNAEGRRLIYRDGARFSTVGPNGVSKYPVYDTHAPEIAEAEVDESKAADEDAFPPEFTGYIEAVENATDWDAVKKAMAEFYATAYFKGLPADQQNHIRANTWDQIKASGLKVPDHAQDVTAFRLWIEWESDADAIEGTFTILQKEKAFIDAAPAVKAAVEAATGARMQRLRNG